MAARRLLFRDPKVATVFDVTYAAVCGLATLGALPLGYVKSRSDPFLRRRFWGRLGRGAELDAAPKGSFLFHGVSVGEVKLVRPLLEAARQRGVNVNPVVSSTTAAGLAEAERQYPNLPRVVFPSEIPGCAARFLRRLRPRAVALLEGEYWPAFLRAAAVDGIAVTVLNGRLSARSAERFALLREYTARRFAGIQLFAMQNAEYASRVVSLGADPARVEVCGNVKFDALPAPGRPPELLTERLGLASGDPLFVAGSTHAPEEGILARAVRSARAQGFPRLRFVLVPRHVERADEIARAIEPIFGPCALWSHVKSAGEPPDPRRPLLVDTVGELLDFYRAARVAFVGGSLGNDRGGQNLLEPAALGVPVLHGPSMRNFEDAVALLGAAEGARTVGSEAELANALLELLANQETCERMAARARAALEPHRGASARMIEALLRRGLLTAR